jgi:exodeoxyribonuclease VII large subunit
MENLSLFELQEFVRRIIALNFPDALWIRAEVAQIKASRGHYYLELVEKAPEQDEIIAQASAVVWKGAYARLIKKLGADLPALLQEGRELLLQVRVDFHERYGLKLNIEDIDPAYTLGRMALQRRLLLQQLETKGLLGKNREAALAPVVQRIAVLSAETAAGYQDFLQQLAENPYGYQYQLYLFPTAMQGAQVETELLKQLQQIQKTTIPFDMAVIIRGGGARLDLVAFDSLAICEAVAAFPLPVLTGIGHDVDETLVDLVAFRALKTPTAVAEWLINHNMRFESQLLEAAQWLKQLAKEQLYVAQTNLERLGRNIQIAPSRTLAGEAEKLERMAVQLPLMAQHQLKNQNQELTQLEQIAQLLGIEETLRRGYSLTYKNGRAVGSTREVQTGDQISTRLKDGVIDSKVE